MANEKDGVDKNKLKVDATKASAKAVNQAGRGAQVSAAGTRIEATAQLNPGLQGTIKTPLLPDHIKNLFEKTRPGNPVVRPDDLVALRIETRNMEIVPGTPDLPISDAGKAGARAANFAPRLRKKGSGAAHLILHFPPQSFAEETFFEQKPPGLDQEKALEQLKGDKYQAYKNKVRDSSGAELRNPPVRARIANESRLVFVVPDGFDIEYSLASVLAACRDLPLKVSAAAKPRSSTPKIFRIPDLLDKTVIKGLPVKRRVALASAVVNTMRIGATGDVTTIQARQFSVGAGFASEAFLPGKVDDPIITNPDLEVLPPQPAAPDATTTSIELPWRLILSPHAGGRWRHAPEAVVSPTTKRTELWHSRLVTPHDGKEIEPPYPDAARTTRAIWALQGEHGEAASKPMTSTWPAPASTQLPAPDPDNPFRTTLDDFDRAQIVHLSSNFRYGTSGNYYKPEPLDTNMMMLTALGGWLDSRGAWDPPGLSVEEWVHRATMGRDHYVRVVYRGFLFPFGHRVSLIKVSERKFHNGNATAEQKAGNTAYLRQRFYLVIREKERVFDDAAFLNAKNNAGDVNFARQFPFTRIKLLTETTPDLDPPEASQVEGKGQLMFWPRINNQPFRFQCAATDLDGRRVVFDLPMIFMDNTLAGPRTPTNTPAYTEAETYAEIARNAFDNKGEWSEYNSATLDWQRVALAPGLKSGDTSVQVEQMQFGGAAEKNNTSLRSFSEGLSRPVWVPKVKQAKARIGPVAHLSGAQTPHTLTYNPTYLRVGFDPTPDTGNRGEVFLDVKSGSGPNLDFSSQGDKSGGFIQPNLKPLALSRMAGPLMSEPTEFIKGKMPQGAGFPTSLSDLPLPFLFGCIPLGALIEAVSDVVGGSDEVPKFGSEASTKIESFINAMVRLFEFVTSVASQPASIGDAALTVFKATLLDLVDQAKSYAAAQMEPVTNAIEALQEKIAALANTLQELMQKTIDAADGASELTSDLPANITAVRNALTQLKNAANATPNGVSLPAGFRQSVLNAVQKLGVLLDQLEQLQALVAAGKQLWDALEGIVGDPDELTNLLSKPDLLGDKVEALAEAVGGFRTALEAFDLLDGAPRNALLAALKAVEDILNVADDILDALAKLVEMLSGDELTIRFDWNPRIDSWSLDGSDDYLFRANDKKGLLVAVEAKVKKNGSSSPKVGVYCGLKHFDLVLIAPASFLELNFEKIEFSIDSSAKMDVDVLLSDIKFLGPLSFVETLRDLIPLDGFSDPPYLDITMQGIDAGFDIALPGVTCGVLNISNLSLGAGFTVPFIGQPLSVRFNFCRRDQPFLLTVYIFGGGGFFGVTIDPQGVQILEASFEFGAAFSIDFGVASGGVHVMAGFYFRMEKTDASLTGYFRLGGHVDVLGIISASIELYLELRYEFSTGKCVGKAELTIEISLFIFSGSVTITCERKFAGSNGDPTLRQMLGYNSELPLEQELMQIDEAAQYAWRDHLEAFA